MTVREGEGDARPAQPRVIALSQETRINAQNVETDTGNRQTGNRQLFYKVRQYLISEKIDRSAKDHTPHTGADKHIKNDFLLWASGTQG